MMGPFLMLMGAFLLFVSTTGKSPQFLNAIGINFGKWQDDVDKALLDWAARNIWTPLTLSIRGIITGQPANSGGSGNKTSSSGTSLFNVPITDSSGGAGIIQVVAHDAASALGNASQGGNTPSGPATSA